MTRALGIIRLSRSADPASTSLERQRDIIESYASANGLTIIGYAEDKATSAFHVPPEKRKAIKDWLARANGFDCLVYWRQDRIVRRAFDFMGLVQWAQQNGKALYSATEGTGDVAQHAQMLVGFIGAWQSEGESRSSSARTKQSQAKLAELGRWRGGRVPFGYRPICVCHSVRECPQLRDCEGWRLTPDEGGTADLVRDIAREVLAGKTVNAIVGELNRRGVPTADRTYPDTDLNRELGRVGQPVPWASHTMRQILRHRATLDLIGVASWAAIQDTVGSRSAPASRATRSDTDNVLRDLVWCGECADAGRSRGKLYRWHRSDGKVFGRCRNEMSRAQVREPCRMSMMPYKQLEAHAAATVLLYGGHLIEERATPNGESLRKVRLDDIDAELLTLSTSYAAKRITRAEYAARHADLLAEQEELEQAADEPLSEPVWRSTGETVSQRWERLSPPERRLWLLRVGLTLTAYWTDESDPDLLAVLEPAGVQPAPGRRIKMLVSYPEGMSTAEDKRERIVRT